MYNLIYQIYWCIVSSNLLVYIIYPTEPCTHNTQKSETEQTLLFMRNSICCFKFKQQQLKLSRHLTIISLHNNQKKKKYVKNYNGFLWLNQSTLYNESPISSCTSRDFHTVKTDTSLHEKRNIEFVWNPIKTQHECGMMMGDWSDQKFVVCFEERRECIAEGCDFFVYVCWPRSDCVHELLPIGKDFYGQLQFAFQ